MAARAPVSGEGDCGYIYRRLADRGNPRVVMVLLLASGLGLILATW
jgi:hypothetical protein